VFTQFVSAVLNLAFSRMCPCELPIELVARVVHDRRRRPVSRHGVTRRRSRDVTILAHGRADYFVSRWNGQTWGHTRRENKKEGGVTRERQDDGNSPVLSTDLSRRSCLCTYLLSERGHFFDDQLLHPIDRVFLFKRKIKFLRHIKSEGEMKVGRG
jgi:hypothetical protein